MAPSLSANISRPAMALDRTVIARNGEVNWRKVSRSTVPLSTQDLARISGTGVDALTVYIGKILCHTYKLDPAVKEWFSTELERLDAYSLIDNMLSAGFNVDFIELVSETEEGFALILIFAALTTTYDATYCAQVLREICSQRKSPEELKPTLESWQAFAAHCSGILMGSLFQTKLLGFQLRILDKVPEERSCVMEPSCMAEALIAFGRVSRGSAKRVTVIGGFDCFWLAAFAEMMLSLDISIHCPPINRLHRSPGRPAVCAQIEFQLMDSGRSRALTTEKASWEFNVPSYQQMIETRAMVEPGCIVTRYTLWSTLLHDAFGKAIDTLLSGPCGEHFVVYLCQLIAINNGGQGHLGSARTILPELNKCPETTPSLMQIPENERAAHCLKAFTESCEGAVGHQSGNCPATFCLRHIAVTVAFFTSMLLSIEINRDVFPSIEGLRFLYEWMSWKQFDATPPFIDVDLAYSTFSGKSVNTNLQGETRAHCGRGICVYRKAVTDISVPMNTAHRFRIVRGHIMHRYAQYERVNDLGIAGGQGSRSALLRP